jgi:hypothetical protein
MVRRADRRLAEIEALYRERFPYFVQVAQAVVGDRERAVEAVQDAFVGVIRSRDSFRGDGPLEAWVWRGSGGGGGGGGPLDLATSVSVSPTQVVPEGSATFHVVVTDVTKTPATHLHVTVTLPTGAVLASTSADRGQGCKVTTTTGVLSCASTTSPVHRAWATSSSA